MKGWLNTSLKIKETRDELSNILYLHFEFFFQLGSLSMPDLTSRHHCLKNKQLKLNAFSGKDSAKGVFNIMHS